MDKSKDPLLAQLAFAPLKRRGFSGKLRLRIENELHLLEKGERRPAKRRSLPIWTGAALVIAVVIFVVLPDLPATEQAANMESAAQDIVVKRDVAIAEATDTFSSGLLLGLRRGGDSAGTYDYRTLWISPDAGKLRVQDEGEGLLVPFSLDFWKIRDVELENGDERIVADRLTNLMKLMDDKSPGLAAGRGFREAVSFVGQEFVSLETEAGAGTTSRLTKLSWLERGESGAVSILDVLESGEQPIEEPADWSIRRKHGEWQVHVRDTAGNVHIQRLSRKALMHDKLGIAWEEIARFEPEATDAISSPTGEWVAVFVPRAVRIYPLGDSIINRRLLEIAVAIDEQPVMAEWATGDYVAKWNEWTKQLLK